MRAPTAVKALKEVLAHILGFCVKKARELLRKSYNFSGDLVVE